MEALEMPASESGIFLQFKFLVDGQWATSPVEPITGDGKELIPLRLSPESGDFQLSCGLPMTVELPPAFHIFYATGWEIPILHMRALNADGSPQTPGWREVPMQNTASRARPSGGWWKTAVIPARGDLAEGTPQLEFYVSNGSGDEVSDLDGTMVGDGAEADAATLEFCAYWEDNAALSGGVLVYNTGRSLGQFLGLWQSKAGALALPDVLITAVGTKIFLLDVKLQDRSRADGQMWKQDTQWARILDEGWDLGRVKQVAEETIGAVGPSCAQWLDDGSEHPHRIALSVRQDRVHEVSERLKEGFLQRDVRIIVSGTGDWRYMDCVSIRGGKLEALERVRTLFSVPRDRCVAAGDSGNDILMLEGANPAIVVGNAQPTLVDWLVVQPQNDRIVFTSAEIARGILEGMSRHGLY
ncbi:S6PP-domain-containing protein [Coccomyxa subellipsoidea C-169]|uniref:S6PP-domain-containing protein n=1 Tax=Coccomyxa subellipsoidea (strain C-169) TaxID=574566 RepID=I0Z807_COCSC|nr:S6PP-domain-containing protein [Coccomyxa subellipsoidea C-169]EIE26776.1 S6PP-domain-containing protein [Coccomyxa subellipsoidea C-169]|eukprot:XP_005651320.1 S6PP-domain-containing protein [Coccomyxa subellipsoidea C-169]